MIDGQWFAQRGHRAPTLSSPAPPGAPGPSHDRSDDRDSA